MDGQTSSNYPKKTKKQSLYSTGEVLVDWQQNGKLATVLQKNMVSGVRRFLGEWGGGGGHLIVRTLLIFFFTFLYSVNKYIGLLP